MSSYDQILLFSPQNCTWEVLDANLTGKRRKLADRLVGGIREAAENHSSRYDLIIGARGTGKTHVLSYIEKSLRREISDTTLRIIRLSEEELGVATHGDLLLSALQAVEAPIDDLYDQLRLPNGHEAAEARLLEYLEGHSSLLVIENLAAMLEAMGEDEQRLLRSFLQRNAHISVVAASPRLYADSGKADHPLYNFFLIHHLERLDIEEAHAFLITLAEWKYDTALVAALRAPSARARIRAVYDMTGGNHRLLGMFSDCLRAEDLKTLVTPFVRMVDRELTPYYQQRLMSLPTQQAKILRVIARHQTPIQVKDIARMALATEQTTASQLRALKGAGLVRSHAQGRESYYELQEPMMRLVLDIKEGRDKLLPSIVALLREWYEVTELRELAQKHDGFSREYYEAALTEKRQITLAVSGGFAGTRLEVGAATEESDATESESIDVPAELLELMALATHLYKAGDYQGTLLALDEVAARFGGREEPTLLVEVAMALVNKGVTLGQLGRGEEAVAVCDEVAARFGERQEPALLEGVARALLNKGVTLGQLGRGEEELAAYDEMAARFGSREEPALLEQVATAIVYKGLSLGQIGRSEEELDAYDEVVARFGSREEPALLEQVARALVDKGVRLGQLGRGEEELVGYDEVAERFAAREEPALLEQVARALFNKGVRLGQLGRGEEELAVYDEVAARFGTREEPAVLEKVAMSLFNKGVGLGQFGRGEEEITVYDEMSTRFGSREEPALLEKVAAALVNKGVRLGKLRRGEEALAIYDEVAARFGTREEPTVLESVARALVYKGVTLGELGRGEEALAVYAEVAARFGAREEIVLIEQVAKALVSKGLQLAELGRGEEALTPLDEVASRFASREEVSLLELVAGALLTKGVTLGQLGRVEEGVEVYREVLTRFGHREELSFRDIVIGALGGLIQNTADRFQDLQRLFAFSLSPDLLVRGLTKFVQWQLPMTKEEAQALEGVERNLRKAFAEVEGADRVLDLFSAARAHSLGDKKALLRLPLESRRLVERAYGLEES